MHSQPLHNNRLAPEVLSLLPEVVQFSGIVADQARTTSLRYFRAKPELTIKADGSPVTIADRETESVIRDLLSQEYPSYAVLGEEHGETPSDQPYTWVIDPIDGTKSFLAGAPTFGMLLALLYHGTPVFGMIDIPALDERWCGAVGQPTTLNGEPVTTSSCESAKNSVLTVVSPDNLDARGRRAAEELARRARVRRYTSDGYAHGLLASGHIDMVVAAGQQPFDYLALVRVVEGAGGCISDWAGQPLGLDSDGRILVTATRRLHGEALDIIRQSSRKTKAGH